MNSGSTNPPAPNQFHVSAVLKPKPDGEGVPVIMLNDTPLSVQGARNQLKAAAQTYVNGPFYETHNFYGLVTEVIDGELIDEIAFTDSNLQFPV